MGAETRHTLASAPYLTFPRWGKESQARVALDIQNHAKKLSVLVTTVLAFLTPATHAATPDLIPSAALNAPIVADLSQTSIEIRSDFNGTQLLMFGARNAPGDLAMVLRGPERPITLRRKARIVGMWMPVDQRKYEALPMFYAIASTRPLSSLAPPSELQALGLGESRIIRASNPKPDETFDPALASLLQHQRWWQAPFGRITYFGESLFKARLDLPDTLPSGDYTAEFYLFNRGALTAMQVIPVKSYKTGFDARVADAAAHQGILYGIGAILMALLGGGLAHRLFQRR